METDYPKRKSKVIPMEEAVSWVKDGMKIGLSGGHATNAPNAFVRELVRKGVKDLTVIPSNVAGYHVDLLIGAGLVKKLYSSYIGFDHLGGAPNYRRVMETGQLDHVDLDELGLLKALKCGQLGYSFFPLPPGIAACDNVKLNPDWYKIVKCPFTGVDVVVVPSLRPDISIQHVAKCDIYGNVQEGCHIENYVAPAGDILIVTTEEVIPLDETKEKWKEVTISGSSVDAVVEVPFGAHPADCHGGGYEHDEEHMKEYMKAAKDTETFKKDYLDKYVYGCKNHAEYMQKIGFDRLFKIKTGRYY